MAGCRTGSCRSGTEATSCDALLCIRSLGNVHEDGRTDGGCCELANICDGPMCLCRQDVRLMRLQNESSSGVTEFGLRTFDGPGMSCTRSLRHAVGWHLPARTQVTDWSPH